MKLSKYISLTLASVMLLTGCAHSVSEPSVTSLLPSEESVTTHSEESYTEVAESLTDYGEDTVDSTEEFDIQFLGAELQDGDFVDPSDEELLEYIENNVYVETVTSLNSDEYYVENVVATYVSDEYLAELEYNSQANIFFGHTEQELEEQFGGTKYIFSLGEDGQTSVEEFQPNDTGLSDAYRQALLNMAVGTGVIVVCVTVAVVSPAVGAPAAITAIFTYSAIGAVKMGVQSGAIGAMAGGLVKAVETGDFDQALEAAALYGSEGFMVGAIIGALTGGYNEYSFLRNVSAASGLTMSEIAVAQKNTKLSIDVLKSINSVEEAKVLEDAKLQQQYIEVNGKKQYALVKDIDWNYIDPKTISEAYPNGQTNLELALSGKAPYDPISGLKYELHHIGQENGGLLAILTPGEHDMIPTPDASSVDRATFKTFRKDFWKAYAAMVEAA